MLTRKSTFITTLALILLLSAVTACQNASPSIPERVPNPVNDTAVQNNVDTADSLPESEQPVQVSAPPAQDNAVDDDSAAEMQQFSQGDGVPDQADDDDDENDLDNKEADLNDDNEDDLDDKEDDLNDNDDGSLVENKQHPVANALAEEFNVDYEEIMALHQAGYGFGEIAKAYTLADKLGMTPQEILPQAQEMGWGELLKAHGLRPSMAGKGNNLGAIMSEQTGQGNRPAHAGPPGGDGPPGLQKKDK